MHLQQSFVVTWVKDTARPLNGKLVCYLVEGVACTFYSTIVHLLALFKQLHGSE